MHTRQKWILKNLLIAAFVVGILCVQSAWSRNAVETKVISGSIVQILANKSIHLDNGEFYLPTRTELVKQLQPGQAVTLRYYVDTNKKNIFFECEEGLNSLEAISSPQKETERKDF